MMSSSCCSFVPNLTKQKDAHNRYRNCSGIASSRARQSCMNWRINYKKASLSKLVMQEISARNRQILARLTMENTVAKLAATKGFLLRWSLLVLLLWVFLLGLSGLVRAGFNQVQEQPPSFRVWGSTRRRRGWASWSARSFLSRFQDVRFPMAIKSWTLPQTCRSMSSRSFSLTELGYHHWKSLSDGGQDSCLPALYGQRKV